MYPYEESPAWHRPHQNCKMRFLGLPFCSVCIEGTLEKIHTLVSPLTGYEPQNNHITDFSPPQTFKIDLIHPNPNTLKNSWELNGLLFDSNQDSVIISESLLTEGLNTLTVYIEDTTQLLRIDNHSSVHLSTVTWYIEKTATGIENISDASKKIFISLYPNPVKDHLNIDFQGESDDLCRIEITDLQGTVQAAFLLNQAQKNSIDLTHLSQGIYIVRFSVNDIFITSGKFIKTN